MKRLLLGLSLISMLTFIFLKPPGRAAALTSNWQKSVNIQSRSSTDFASTSFDQSVDKAIADGANYIVLVVIIHQSNIYTTDVKPGADTPTDQSISSAVSYIHSKGAHAVINIHDDPYDGQWRAYINPSDRASWFTNYGAQLNHYATIAKSTGTEEMVLGTELTHMTSIDFAVSNTTYWQAMISNVRSIYGGSLTYSAQHDGFLSDLASLGFWPQLDYIGISAYYGLGTDTSVSAIESQWANLNNSYIKPIAAKYNKQILFTEVGYASKTNTLNDPGIAYQQSGAYDATLQANAYQAMFDYWNNFSYFSGVAMWDWSSDPAAGGPGNTDYTPQNKPAEAIMKQYFTTPVPITGGQVGGTATATTFTIAGQSTTATVGSPKSVTANIKASQPVSNVLVDLELYDGTGNRVAQQYYDTQSLSTIPTTYSLTFTPTNNGNYILKAGVFTAGWTSNLSWNNSVATVMATTVNPAPTPIPTPVPTPAPTPTPTPIPAPVAGVPNLAIWWPGASQPVGGLQPFKALLEGIDINTYDMFWQVDGGVLSKLANYPTPIIHKESSVDLTSWNWSPNSTYTINFIAKKLDGTLITQKAVLISVQH